MTNIHDVAIVGAGSAGLTCSHALQDAGADFVTVAESLGGRIAYDPAQGVNFGAYFVMANYHHAAKLVIRRTRINPLACRFHDGHGNSFPTLSTHTLKRSPGFAAFAAAMAKFILHYERYKRNCESLSQRQAMRLDPYIGELFAQPASAFIAMHKLEQVAQDYISKFSYACTGVDLDSITALDFCNVSQGLIIPIHRFEFDAEGERRRLGAALIEDRVLSHSVDDGVHELGLSGGQQISARNVIFATPAAVTAEFLGLEDLRATCQLYVEHVRGTLRPQYAGEQMNLFPFSSPIIFTAKQDDDSFLVYSREPEIDFDALFADHESIDRRAWEKAMYVSGRAYVEQQYGDSTYVAGDHNGLGLEPAAISGLYAARQVLNKLPI